jgi:hypothetical protein
MGLCSGSSRASTPLSRPIPSSPGTNGLSGLVPASRLVTSLELRSEVPKSQNQDMSPPAVSIPRSPACVRRCLDKV